MHDIGGLIWVIIVVIGIISSLSRSARRARQRASASPPPAPPRPTTVPQAFAASAGLVMPPVIPPRVVLPPVPAPPPRAPAAMPQVHPVEPAGSIGTSPIRGMFQGPATLVRAIVAAEVLGPPKSMQEQTIWSPRHSEPSI